MRRFAAIAAGALVFGGLLAPAANAADVTDVAKPVIAKTDPVQAGAKKGAKGAATNVKAAVKGMGNAAKKAGTAGTTIAQTVPTVPAKVVKGF